MPLQHSYTQIFDKFVPLRVKLICSCPNHFSLLRRNQIAWEVTQRLDAGTMGLRISYSNLYENYIKIRSSQKNQNKTYAKPFRSLGKVAAFPLRTARSLQPTCRYQDFLGD